MKLKRNILILLVVWTLIIGFSLSMSYFQAREAARNSATAAARSLFTKDVLYRRWNANHDGVYVPITESAQPNPYLTRILDRDIETLSGKRLTLINPSYMTRQVHELGLEGKGIGGDITSLDPIRPANAPDSWQKKALKEFEQGANAYVSVKNLQGKERLRFMRPLMTEKACLKCHARQGYESGDVRGGISVTLSMGPYISGMRKQMTFLGSVYGIIWFLGLSGLGFAYMFNRRRMIERAQMQRSLQASEKRLRDITQTMGEGLYVKDNQGGVTFVNPAAAALLGYSEKDLSRRVGHDLFHVHDKQGKRMPLQQSPIFQAVIQGKTYRGEVFFQHRNKSIFPVEVIGRPMWDNGQVAGSVTAFKDITERKKVEESLRESEERFRTTLENLPGAVFTHDMEGSIILVNRAASRQTGYSRKELLQMKVEDIDPQAPVREDILDIWQNMQPGQSSMVETTHIRKDGSQYPAQALINAIAIDRQPVMLAVRCDNPKLTRCDNAKLTIPDWVFEKITESAPAGRGRLCDQASCWFFIASCSR